MITRLARVFFWSLCLAMLVGGPAWSDPEPERPSEPELVAVFLVDGIYPGTALSLRLLAITEAGPATYPSADQLLANVTAAYADGPFAPYYYHQPAAVAGDFQLFLAEPGDFGAVTIVDIRDGAVVFASQMVWMGYGDMVTPTVSSHPWSWEAGLPAAPPTDKFILPAWGWGDEYWGSQAYLAQVALDYLRQTDVVRSFGACAAYQATTYLHTPTVGATDPNVAVQVVIIRGHAAPPWGPGPIGTTLTSWDQLKSFFRGNNSN